MSLFKVGDKIEIVNSGREYRFTKDGSIGTITNVMGDRTYCIMFSLITGETTGAQRDYGPWYIDEQYLMLEGGKEITKIEHKARIMFERQPYYKKLKGL